MQPAPQAPVPQASAPPQLTKQEKLQALQQCLQLITDPATAAAL